MIHEFRISGYPVLIMTSTDIAAATAWARARCVAVHGPEEGERVFRTLSAITMLRAWRDVQAALPTT